MIIKKIKRMLTRNEEMKLQLLIEEVTQNEELRAKAQEKRPIYINPSAIRLGCQIKQSNIFFFLTQSDYCPV